jgi:hypothetical protein
MVQATLGHEQLSPSETLILTWSYWILASHVKTHAAANWAINFSPKQKECNPFHARNSIVTIILDTVASKVLLASGSRSAS